MSIYSEMHPLYYAAHPVQAIQDIQAVITQSSKYKFESGNELQKICFILWKEMWNLIKSSRGINNAINNCVLISENWLG